MLKITTMTIGLLACAQASAFEYLDTERRGNNQFFAGASHDVTDVDYTFSYQGNKTKFENTLTSDKIAVFYRPSEFQFSAIFDKFSWSEGDGASDKSVTLDVEYMFNRNSTKPIVVSIDHENNIDGFGADHTGLSVTIGTGSGVSSSEYGFVVSSDDDSDISYGIFTSSRFGLTNDLHIFTSAGLSGTNPPPYDSFKGESSVGFIGKAGLGIDIIENLQVATSIDISRYEGLDRDYNNSNARLSYKTSAIGFNLNLIGKF